MPENLITWASLVPVTPEICLVVAICAVLLVDVFAGEKRAGLTSTLTLLALAVSAALTVRYAHVTERVVLLNGMYVADELAFVLKLAGFLVVAVALLYSRSYLINRNILRGEYYVLALTALLGIFVLVSANSLLTVYLGVELLALSVYAMVAFDRDSGIAAESAMKYFVLGAIASGALLYGMSLIYGLTGTLELGEIAARLSTPSSLGVIMGLVFIVVAVAFKLGAVPFHMWLPDVYEGAPTSVTLFIGTVPKIGYFALALRLLAQGLAGMTLEWTQMLAALAVLTLVVGNVVAIVQTNLKRMLAYSTIANVGFIVLGFVAGTPDGYAAALFYTLQYVLVALGSFGVILIASRRGFEADKLDDYKGLYQRDPLSALAMMLLMFSTAGVPPLVGFWAKLRIFQALWETNHLWLVIIAAAMSVVGAYYYLRVIKLMYFDEPVAPAPPAAAAAGGGAPHSGSERRGGAGARHPARAPAEPVRTADPLKLRCLRTPLDGVRVKHARLRPSLALSAAWGLAACLLGIDAAAAPPQYGLAKVPEAAGDTGWDYLAFEQGGHRLFIAHGTQVDVIDTKRLTRIGEIADTPGVHGIALAPELRRGFISAGASGTIIEFDLQSLARLKEIKSTGENPDAIIYDRATRRVFAFNGRGRNVTVHRCRAPTEVIGTIELEARPEFAARGRQGARVRKPAGQEQSRRHRLALARAAVGVAAQRLRGTLGARAQRGGRDRLFSVCANHVMVVTDAALRDASSAPPRSAPASMRPPTIRVRTSRLASCGEGVLIAVTPTASGALALAQSVPTQRGARTMALDERTHRIYLVTAELRGAPAPSAEQPHPRPAILPGTFRLLVVYPQHEQVTTILEGKAK